MFQDLILNIAMFYEFFGMLPEDAKGTAIMSFLGGVLLIGFISVVVAFKLIAGKGLEDM